MKAERKEDNFINAEKEIEVKNSIIKIRESLFNIDKLIKLMRKNWESEEGEAFFCAYNEFKSVSEQLLLNFEKGSMDCEDTGVEIQPDVLKDNIIS